jgi:hypothetical protein
MADSILFIADYVVNSTAQEITCSYFTQTQRPWSDEVIYVLDFDVPNSGSIELMQNESDTSGLMLKSNSLAQAETGGWRIDTHPRWLYASGSNSVNVRLTAILDKK